MHDFPSLSDIIHAGSTDVAFPLVSSHSADAWVARQGTEGHAQSFAKKSSALANALHQQGRTAAALQRLGTSTALLAQLPHPPAGPLQYLIQSFVHLRSTLADEQKLPARVQAKQRGRGSRAGARGHRQKSALGNMQADAAGVPPAGAPVAAYIQQPQSPLAASMQGRIIAMELKALHQVLLC